MQTILSGAKTLIDPKGRITARYDKIHLFDVDLPSGEKYRESNTVAGGDAAVLADLPWGKLGLTICYDLRFPQLYRALAKSGAFALTVPSAFTETTGKAHWHVLLRARAIENGAFVIDRPVRPADVCWTVYEALGIDPAKELRTPEGRPVAILNEGASVKELFT